MKSPRPVLLEDFQLEEVQWEAVVLRKIRTQGRQVTFSKESGKYAIKSRIYIYIYTYIPSDRLIISVTQVILVAQVEEDSQAIIVQQLLVIPHWVQ